MESRGDDTHIARVLGQVDPVSIRDRGFSVVLDSVNGAGCRSGLKLLELLGCDVLHLNGDPTGEFAHTPEPKEANLGTLMEVTAESDAVLGFAQDPDADRLAIVDGDGRYIGEEYTLALVTDYILRATVRRRVLRWSPPISPPVAWSTIWPPAGRSRRPLGRRRGERRGSDAEHGCGHRRRRQRRGHSSRGVLHPRQPRSHGDGAGLDGRDRRLRWPNSSTRSPRMRWSSDPVRCRDRGERSGGAGAGTGPVALQRGDDRRQRRRPDRHRGSMGPRRGQQHRADRTDHRRSRRRSRPKS